MDVIDRVAERAGLQVNYICKNGWNEMMDSVGSGEADLSALLWSRKREEKLLFSSPIDTTSLAFFARSRSVADPALAPSDHVVGVIRGSMSQEQLKDRTDVKLQIYGSYRDGLFGLLSGEISLFAGEESMVLKQMQETRLGDRIKKVGKPFVERQRCLVVSKGNVQLVGLLNKALSGFVSGPEYQQIYLKWYGTPEPYWTNRRVLTASGVFLLIALGAIASWRYVSISRINAELLRTMTERRQAEIKLRESENFVRNILDTVDEGFIAIDRDFLILTANKAYCGQVGRTCAEVIGRRCYEISHRKLRPCYEEGEECAVRKVFETGEPHTALHKHPDHKGSILYVETKAFPVKDGSGAVTSVIETVNNITEKYLLEEEQLKTQKLEAIGTLAGGIAHDFNNLLQGVFGYISMAKLTLDQKKKSSQMLEQAEKALHMSVNLTTQLPTFSKGGTPVKKKIQLQQVIENSVKFALSGSRAEYCITIEDNLFAVEADEGQIGQVIQNIVLNADQAMPLGGTILITARNLLSLNKALPHPPADGKYVEISVRDTGIGIAGQYLRKIFDPYFTTKDKGSGLGLATSYAIVRNHGGFIDVDSEPGKGTTFTVCLPAVEAGKETPASSAVSRSGHKGRILVMDDEEMVRDIAGELIKALGHEVDFAESGETAIGKHQAAVREGKPYDITILDLTIRGGLGGRETLERLLAIEPNIRAIVSSGYSDDAVISDYLSYGFKACLAKPYRLEELRNTLDSLLNC